MKEEDDGNKTWFAEGFYAIADSGRFFVDFFTFVRYYNKKTEAERIHEYLLSIGGKEITAEEKKIEWYKNEMNTLDCPFSEKEFENLSNK